jgi:hypothetical protein
MLTIEQLAARLAGGFLRSVDGDSLRLALQEALPSATLGELDGIKSLPGMVNAAVQTLSAAWRVGIDIQAGSAGQPRLAALAQLERDVLTCLPTGMLRPGDLVDAALARSQHAQHVLGSVEISGLPDLDPCWRGLVLALATQVPLRWIAGPRAVPAWLDGQAITVEATSCSAPELGVTSAATPAHEALEAVRWARALLASGEARPEEIAMAAAEPSPFDSHLMALSAEAGIELHSVHGVPVTVTRDGQGAASLADILVSGLSQSRLRRLGRLCPDAPLFAGLPEQWFRVLPDDSTLASPGSWQRFLDRLRADDWPDKADHTPLLRTAVELLSGGTAAAVELGEQVLRGRALSIWRRALVAGPPASLLATIDGMRQDDGRDACTSVTWMPASVLAASPRRFVRLLGLNAGVWPGANVTDGLLPEHVVPAAQLHPLPRGVSDRTAFDAIVATTTAQVVLSFARRNDEGRRLGLSPLLSGQPQPVYLRRHAVPPHALSESDRLAAHPVEFRDLPEAVAAVRCWNDWQRPEITAHDGCVREGHAVLNSIAARTHSASSLRLLLRNPLGYLWRYGLQWDGPEISAEPLLLDSAAFGNLVHEVLCGALQRLEAGDGLGNATVDAIAAAVDTAAEDASARWAASVDLPPVRIWRGTLDQARTISRAALVLADGRTPGMAAYGEVAFGGAEPNPGVRQPWDPATPVTFPGTALQVSGYIDRLDVSPDGRTVHVRDYKTGKPVKADLVLGAGAELQRSLYALAAQAMMGDAVTVQASLLYPRDGIERTLEDPARALGELTAYLNSAVASLERGHCLPGPDAGGDYDKFKFMLPANAVAGYGKRKADGVRATLGDAALVWEAK